MGHVIPAGRRRRRTGRLAVLLVVAVILAVLALGLGNPWPRLSQTGGLPWWAWLGGFCGAVVLSATTAVAPMVGTASMIALVMVGQVVASMTLDHAGLFGVAVQSFSLQRFIAAILLVTGAVLIGTAKTG